MKKTKLAASILGFSLTVSVLIFGLVTLFNDEVKQSAPGTIYEYSGKFEGLVEIQERRYGEPKGKYYLTVNDFNPTEQEFELYLRQFANSNDRLKYMIITADTLIIDLRTEKEEIWEVNDQLFSLFNIDDKLKFKVFLTKGSTGQPYLLVKELEIIDGV